MAKTGFRTRVKKAGEIAMLLGVVVGIVGVCLFNTTILGAGCFALLMGAYVALLAEHRAA